CAFASRTKAVWGKAAGLTRLTAVAAIVVSASGAWTPALAAGTTTIGTVHLTRGWATFGQVLPQCRAPDALSVRPATGDPLPTQTDVKVRWDDLSVRFAVVTVNVPADGDYTITSG